MVRDSKCRRAERKIGQLLGWEHLRFAANSLSGSCTEGHIALSCEGLRGVGRGSRHLGLGDAFPEPCTCGAKDILLFD